MARRSSLGVVWRHESRRQVQSREKQPRGGLRERAGRFVSENAASLATAGVVATTVVAAGIIHRSRTRKAAEAKKAAEAVAAQRAAAAEAAATQRAEEAAAAKRAEEAAAAKRAAEAAEAKKAEEAAAAKKAAEAAAAQRAEEDAAAQKAAEDAAAQKAAEDAAARSAGEAEEAEEDAGAAKEAEKCSRIVGNVRIRAQFDREAGEVVSGDPCLDQWAAEWTARNLPRIAPFDFAFGALERGKSRRIVEIHNNPNGNCLLYAFGFYLCVTKPDLRETAETASDLREILLTDVQNRLMSKDEQYNVDRMQAATDAEGYPEAKVPPELKGNLIGTYLFLRRSPFAELGPLEIAAFARLYSSVRVWRIMNKADGTAVLRLVTAIPDVPSSYNKNVTSGDTITDFGACVNLRYYDDARHYTLLALLETGDTGFGRLSRRRRYV
jgi:hypothetical protein